ncbi:hypothetical protein K439DRAFT_463133 [Ramaria rubella]|nr:hypothetical protein K439DRAFT_463133 [Ramaria rubella]
MLSLAWDRLSRANGSSMTGLPAVLESHKHSTYVLPAHHTSSSPPKRHYCHSIRSASPTSHPRTFALTMDFSLALVARPLLLLCGRPGWRGRWRSRCAHTGRLATCEIVCWVCLDVLCGEWRWHLLNRRPTSPPLRPAGCSPQKTPAQHHFTFKFISRFQFH